MKIRARRRSSISSLRCSSADRDRQNLIREDRSHPVSRILCLCGHLSGNDVAVALKRPHQAWQRTINRSQLRTLGGLPQSTPSRPCSRWGLPGASVSRRPVRSYRTISPLPRAEARGGMFLWHFPSGRPARPLAGIVALWSPDFPPKRAA